MIGASRFYLLNLPHHHHRHSYLPSFPIQDNAALLSRFPTVKHLMSEEAFEALGNHHPLFSPSAMALIETKRGQKPLEFVEAFDYDDDDEANEGNGSPPTGSRTSSAQSSSSNIKQPGSRSPSPSSSDPFVPLTSLFLAPLASHSKPPRFFCHHGSVELFADEIVHFESLLRSNGLQCDSYTEKGGFHCISGIFPPLLEESGGPNAKSEGLAGTMRRYLGVGKAEARASKAWKGWWEGGGSREAGGEGWWY
jgi:acetyl esterase/lipase